MQHPSRTNSEINHCVPDISHGGSFSKSITSFSYTIVPPVSIKGNEFSAPTVAGPVKLSNLLTASAAREYKYAWVSKVKEILENSFINERISWSAYQAHMQKCR